MLSGEGNNNGSKTGIMKGKGKCRNDKNDDGKFGISKARVVMMQ